MPQTTPPIAWLRAVRGLSTRPQSNMLTTLGSGCVRSSLPHALQRMRCVAKRDKARVRDRPAQRDRCRSVPEPEALAQAPRLKPQLAFDPLPCEQPFHQEAVRRKDSLQLLPMPASKHRKQLQSLARQMPSLLLGASPTEISSSGYRIGASAWAIGSASGLSIVAANGCSS